MDRSDPRYHAYVQILKEELIPAMGCTEPIALAYAGAVARRTLGELPDRVTVQASGSIIKNVKSVIVPNTDHLKGIDAAVSAGIVAGDPDKKLEVIAQKFQPDWLEDEKGRLTYEAYHIIEDELKDYLVTGSVYLWYGEVKPGQSAQAQAGSMKQSNQVEVAILEPGILLKAIAFTMTDKKSDGHRYYLALETYATIKTPQT